MVTSAHSEHKNACEAVSESNSNEMVQSNERNFISSVGQERREQPAYHGDDDDENLPLRRVVIDDEEEEGSEAVSDTQERLHASGLPYEDHNYGDISRSANSSRANEENGETFPVIAGLASYFGEDEIDDQTTILQRSAPVAEPSPISYRGPIRETYYRQSEQSASGYSYGSQSQTTYRITQGPGTNLVTIGGRTYVRQTTANTPQGYRSTARDNYSSGSTIGGASYAIGAYTGTRRMSSGVSQLKRALRPSGIAMAHSGMRIGVVSSAPSTKQLPSAYASPVNAANIVADPMRVANDNAPAPFIVPARGSKPTFRSKAQNGRGRNKPEQHDDLIDSSMNVYKMSASPHKIATFGTALAARQKSPTRLHQQLSAPYSSSPKSDYMMAGQVESGRAPQSEIIDIHYHGTMENEPHVNVTTIDGSAERTTVASSGREGEIKRAVESPVTCIVESAHREAIRRASESAPLGHQPPDYKQFLDGQQQRIATPRGRGRPPRMRSSLSANHSAGGQLGSNLQHMRGTRMRNSPSRSPSKTHSQSPYRGSRGVRQVPTSPGHVAGVFSHSAVLSPPRMRIRSRQHAAQQQQEEFMLLQQQQAQPSKNLIPTMPQPISLPPAEGPNEPFQPEQSQLSSPEQQMPLSVPQPMETQSIMPGSYHSSAVSPSQLQSSIPLEGLSFEPSTASPGHVEIASHLGHLQAYVNEELSSGDELLLSQIPDVQDSQFIASRQPMPAGRSSTSAAEEENSFTEDLTEEKGTEEEGCDERSIVENLSGASSLKDSSEESWDEDYTTRCYCGLDHNDEFMIQCDTCKVWQHVKCMGMDRKHIPKVYKCEQCQPRPMKLTKTEAREMQMKALAKLRKEKERRKQRKAKRRDERVKKRMQKRTVEKKPVAKKQLNATDQFQQTNTYDYSRAVMAFSRRHEDTCDPPKMDSVKNNEGLAVMFVTQVVRGLVSLRSFSVSEPVVYVCGRVSLPNECPGREKAGSLVPFVALYSELYLDGESESTPVCIDMRKSGSVARYARRSCHPNVKLQHFFIGGKIHFVAVATEKVERGDEITFPFDNDYAQSTEKLVCACCSQLEEDEGIYPAPTSEEAYVCPIKVLNHDLARREQRSTPLESVSKKVMSKAINVNNSNKNKHVTKKVGVSVAKMLHKKAIQRVRKAKGMQKTNGKGCPPTASVKASNTHSARGRPPMRTAGGVSHTSRNSKTELKTAVSEVKVQPEQQAPVATTDEESSARKNTLSSKAANRKSMISPQKQNATNPGSKKVKTSMSVTAQRKKKGTIKLKRRMRKPSTRNTEEKTKGKDNTKEENTMDIEELNNTAAIEESKEEKGASDADLLCRKQTRSITAVTAATDMVADSDLSQSTTSVKNEEGEVSIENSEIKLNERSAKVENEKDEVIARVTRSSTIQQQKDIAAEQKVKSQKSNIEDNKEATEVKKEMEKETEISREMMEPKEETNDASEGKKESDGKKTDEKKEINTKKSAKGKRKRAEEDSESGETKGKDTEKIAAKKSHHAKDGKVPMQEMNYMLPEDRNKAVSREERKLQQQIALMERMQANEKRKGDKRQHVVESPQQRNITSPSSEQPLALSTSIEHKEEIEKNEPNKEDVSTKKRISRSSRRANDSKASVDGKRSRTSSSGSTKRTSTAVTKNIEKQHEQAKVKKEESEKTQEESTKMKESMAMPSQSLSPPGVHISPPPRKRWASSAATNIANDSPKNAAVGSIGVSPTSTNTPPTPSPVSGKKAWLLQRAQQTQETTNEEHNEACTESEAVHTNGTPQKTSVPPVKKKRNAADSEKARTKLNDGYQPESDNISHEDAAMLLTQMATDGMQPETKVFISCATTTSPIQRPLVSPSGEGLDIRAQIGKLAAADVARGMREFSLSTLVSSGLPVVASTSSANGDPSNVVPPSVVNTRPPKKKMSLDEYRKRRATSHEKIEDRPVVTAVIRSEATQQTNAPHSFIPTINTNEISRRASLRLGAIPDPAQLKVVPTASLDDLKERIYGKRTPASSGHEGTSPSLGIGTFTRKFSSASKTPSESEMNDGRVSAVVPPPRTPPPPPPPPPPSKTVTVEAREARMSLEERMRLVLGCGTEVETNQNTLSGGAPPPPPPPPLLTSDRGEPRRSRPPVSLATVSTTSNVISPGGRTPPPPRAAAALSNAQSTRTRR